MREKIIITGAMTLRGETSFEASGERRRKEVNPTSKLRMISIIPCVQLQETMNTHEYLDSAEVIEGIYLTVSTEPSRTW